MTKTAQNVLIAATVITTVGAAIGLYNWLDLRSKLVAKVKAAGTTTVAAFATELQIKIS